MQPVVAEPALVPEVVVEPVVVESVVVESVVVELTLEVEVEVERSSVVDGGHKAPLGLWQHLYLSPVSTKVQIASVA